VGWLIGSGEVGVLGGEEMGSELVDGLRCRGGLEKVGESLESGRVKRKATYGGNV